MSCRGGNGIDAVDALFATLETDAESFRIIRDI